MGAIKPDVGTKTEDIRIALAQYWTHHSFSGVEFHETTSPTNNPLEQDYIVTYEAVFEPADFEHAYLKISVTDSGQVGIGLETRERLARRLGIRLSVAKKAFAVGCEIVSISTEELINFVTIVAQGNVALQAKVGLMGGLGSVKAIVKPESAGWLRQANPNHWNWLVVSSKDMKDTPRTKIVRFDPWLPPPPVDR